MSTAARAAEADRVELVYHYALAQFGASIIAEATELWQDVPATPAAASNTRYLSTVLRLVMLRRSVARDLALAYYRLVRGLRTGATIRDPRRPASEPVSLEQLRKEFEELVDEVAPGAPQSEDPSPSTSEPSQAAQPTAQPSPDPLQGGDDDVLVVEEIADLEAEAERQARDAEEEAALVIDKLGVENLLKKMEAIDQEQTAVVVDKLRDEAHRQAGARQAAAAERITLNAARGLTYSLASTDLRVIGWARFSTTGTPCGWCAMLISREVLYKSKQSASNSDERRGKNAADETDLYHDNCHCIAIPVFSQEQYDTSPVFDKNREYLALWNQHIKGQYGGEDALTVWRKLFRDMKHQHDTQTQAAA